MNERPDLSALTDKEVHELSAAVYDMHAAIMRLAYFGLIDTEHPETTDLDSIMTAIDAELHLRLMLRRALKGGE